MRRFAGILLALLVATAVGCLSGGAAIAWAGEPPAAGKYRGEGFLDNGAIRLGVNLDLGGAITWLSESKSDDNVVNSWDYGRQIQMSYYSGPVPFVVGDKQPRAAWKLLGWNPIQAGDDFHHGRVLEYRNDGREIYVRCIPMQWPLDNVPGECTCECWITLEANTVHVRSRLNNARSDKTQYPARRQELPAVYSNGPLYRLMTYSGEKPFTGDTLARIEKKRGEPGPWSAWQATENWAALVRDDNWGLGVWNPGCYAFGGGFAGQPGKGGPHDSPTGYISPGYDEILDHNIVYEYNYVLILGQLDEIRRYVYDHAQRRTTPDYHFDRDRQHWHFVHAHDTGWPIAGELHVLLDQNDPQLIGPDGFWQATDAPRLEINAAFHTTQQQAQVFWKSFDDRGFSNEKSLTFPIQGDGRFRVYQVDLSSSPLYHGAITGLRFDPVPNGAKGEFVRVKSITMAKPQAK